MKRLLADFLLIIILVSIGSYINQQDKGTIQQQIETNVTQFEDDIAQHKKADPKQVGTALHDIHDNAAGRLAQSGSTLVIDILHGTVGMLSEIFNSLIQ